MKIITDMDDNSEMKKDAIEMAQKLLGRNNIKEDDATRDIKTHFDKKYLPNWHCIIGKTFTHHLHMKFNAIYFFILDK